MILKGESAEEFNRKADENYEKFKARQKQNLIDMMEADEKLGLYQKPTKFYTIEDIERCVENWGLCKVEREYIEKFLATKQVVKDSLTTQTVEKWEDFELYDVFETAIQESALTVVTKYHNLHKETTELALECVRIFKELKGTTDQGLQEAAENVVAWERSTNNLMKLIGLLDELEKSLKATN
jgi:hypothetical protein